MVDAITTSEQPTLCWNLATVVEGAVRTNGLNMSDTTSYRPRLAVTLGDPAGIGPEVVLKALAMPPADCDVTIVGSRSLLIATYEQLRSLHPELTLAHPDHLHILDVPADSICRAANCDGAGKRCQWSCQLSLS